MEFFKAYIFVYVHVSAPHKYHNLLCNSLEGFVQDVKIVFKSKVAVNFLLTSKGIFYSFVRIYICLLFFSMNYKTIWFSKLKYYV
jgi:hypothetical protein